MVRCSLIVFSILLPTFSLVIAKDLALPNVAQNHPAIPASNGISRRAPYLALPHRQMVDREASPLPQSNLCYTCEKTNGEKTCVPQGASCCEDKGYCEPPFICCYGKCLHPSTQQCCDTPGVFCDNSYECYKDPITLYPQCCTDKYCFDQDSINIVVGYNVPRPSTTAALRTTTTSRAVWSTYSITVYWTYYYYYYLYIDVHRTTTLTSQQTVTTTVLYATATDYINAYYELSESEVAIIRRTTIDQPTTTFRGQTPPATLDTSPTKTPNDFDTGTDFPPTGNITDSNSGEDDLPPGGVRSLGGLTRVEMLSGVVSPLVLIGALVASVITLVF